MTGLCPGVTQMNVRSTFCGRIDIANLGNIKRTRPACGRGAGVPFSSAAVGRAAAESSDREK